MSGKHVTKQSQRWTASHSARLRGPLVERTRVPVPDLAGAVGVRCCGDAEAEKRCRGACGRFDWLALSAAIAVRGLVIREAGLFVAINSLADWPYYAIWPFMQFGVFVAIPILVVIALVMRRVRLAAAMAIGGVGVDILALVAKGIIDRGRPAALLAVVEGREMFVAGSLDFLCGYAAVAAAPTVVVTPYLSGRRRYVPVALLAIVIMGVHTSGLIFRSIFSGELPPESLRGARPTWLSVCPLLSYPPPSTNLASSRPDNRWQTRFPLPQPRRGHTQTRARSEPSRPSPVTEFVAAQ
jgi:hypothetical protein